jgi:hypothetical protein
MQVRRDLDLLPRQTESQDKNLSDQLQALEVQVQDTDTESETQNPKPSTRNPEP